MATVITLKTDNQGNELLAMVDIEEERDKIVLQYIINNKLTNVVEYPFNETLVKIFKDIEVEIDKHL